MGTNLIPNSDFALGLTEWECTPAGVSLVATAAKRFVQLAGETRAAAICSDPIEVTVGGAYELSVERAIRGDADITMIGRSSLLRPEPSGEVVPVETPVRIQVTCPSGKSVGISRVLLTPIGPRLRIENVRTTSFFAQKGQPFEIKCEVRNTGSEAIEGAELTLRAPRHDVPEDQRRPLVAPIIDVGAATTARWHVLSQRRAIAEFEVEARYGHDVAVGRGASLKHIPSDERVKASTAISGTRRWFAISARGLRFVAHDTDVAFGPILVIDEISRSRVGVLDHIVQVVDESGNSIPLYAEMHKVGNRQVELRGSSEMGCWTILASPDLRNGGATFDVAFRPKHRLRGVRFEFGPFHTNHAMAVAAGSALVLCGRDGVPIRWISGTRGKYEVVSAPESGLMKLCSERANVLPGTLHKASATLCRGKTELARA